MNLSTSVLGTATVRHIRERLDRAVLTIGTDTFTLHDLAAVDCYHALAARTLSDILKDAYGSKLKNTADLFAHVSPRDLALPRLGAIALAVLGAAFEAKGLGGQAPLETWARQHLDATHTAITTFASIKHHERDAEAHGRRPRRRSRSRPSPRI